MPCPHTCGVPGRIFRQRPAGVRPIDNGAGAVLVAAQLPAFGQGRQSGMLAVFAFQAFAAPQDVYKRQGVGGGVVIDGKIYEGQASAGAELGHCTLISGGVQCTCGRRGCIESYASATALIRQASEAAAAHPEDVYKRQPRWYTRPSLREGTGCRPWQKAQPRRRK